MHVLIAVAALALVVSVVVWALSPSTEKIQIAWSELSAPFQAINKDLPTLWRVWIETSPALAQEIHLKTWLQGLSNDGLQALAEKTAEFCAEMNADMDWLFEAEADLNPYAKAASEELVIDYCKLCFKAVQKQLLAA